MAHILTFANIQMPFKNMLLLHKTDVNLTAFILSWELVHLSSETTLHPCPAVILHTGDGCLFVQNLHIK